MSLVEEPAFVIRLTPWFGGTLGRLSTYQSATFIAKWLEPGTFSITTSIRAPGAELFQFFPNVEVMLPGGRTFWGVIDDYELSWDPEEGVMITVSGKEAKSVFANYLCWPLGTGDLYHQPAEGVNNYALATLEDIALDLVRVNCLSPADTYRLIPNLVVPAAKHRGPNTANYPVPPWSNLLDNLITLLSATGLGMSLRLNPANRNFVLFDTQAGNDLTNLVTVSPDRSNLTQLTVSRKPPTVDTVYQRKPYTAPTDINVMTRYISPRSTTWGGIHEAYQDASGADDSNTPESRAAKAQEVLDSGQEVNLVKFQVQDTDQIQFGRDYNLGDKIGFKFNGLSLEDLVSSVELSNTADSFRITPTIGTGDDTTRPGVKNTKAIQSLTRRLNLLERS
jgi:hypothetical protein